MKAVLVIDLPVSEDEIRDVGFLANVHVFPSIASERQYEYENVVVRPLPQKKGISLKEAIGIKCSCYSDGWNACLGEITGEKE